MPPKSTLPVRHRGSSPTTLAQAGCTSDREPVELFPRSGPCNIDIESARRVLCVGARNREDTSFRRGVGGSNDAARVNAGGQVSGAEHRAALNVDRASRNQQKLAATEAGETRSGKGTIDPCGAASLRVSTSARGKGAPFGNRHPASVRKGASREDLTARQREAAGAGVGGKTCQRIVTGLVDNL